MKTPNNIIPFVGLILIPGMLLHMLPCNAQREFKTNLAQGTIYLNDEFTPLRFSRIVVFTGIHDVTENKKIMEEFRKLNIEAVNSLELFPPFRDYSAEEQRRTYENENIDGIMRAEIRERMADNSTARMEIELSLSDEENATKALTCFGRGVSFIGEPDKAMRKFFEAVVSELQTMVNQENH